MRGLPLLCCKFAGSFPSYMKFVDDTAVPQAASAQLYSDERASCEFDPKRDSRPERDAQAEQSVTVDNSNGKNTPPPVNVRSTFVEKPSISQHSGGEPLSHP
jgi:hypothetical protein